MNRNKLIKLSLLFSFILLASCSRTEFLPEPEGAPIPFEEEATKSVEELLAASPAKLYYSAWQKSHMKQMLAAKGNKVVFTVFAPDDAAMEAAGFSAAVINQMPVEELDSLMMFYTSLVRLNKEELQARPDNFILKTMRGREGLYVKYYESEHINAYDDFSYRHFLALKGAELLINGKSVGQLNYTPATNGSLYVIKNTIARPVKTMLEALKDDGRFTLFLESQRIADEHYIDQIATALEAVFGYRPEPEEMVYYIGNRVFYQSGLGVEKPPYDSYVGPNLIISTLFAPTDEAFHKAGFQTLQDIVDFNNSRSNVRFDENTYSGTGGFPMDTIYSFHRDFGRVYAPQDPGYGKTASNSTIFYSNVLHPGLNSYMVNIGGNPTIEYAYQMPLEFTQANGSIQIKPKASEYPSAKVIESDINTLNGPIHVVDQLLIPKGFKLK